jgi:hypothetical protein
LVDWAIVHFSPFSDGLYRCRHERSEWGDLTTAPPLTQIDLGASSGGLRAALFGDAVPTSPEELDDLDIDTAAGELDELYDLNSALSKYALFRGSILCPIAKLPPLPLLRLLPNHD